MNDDAIGGYFGLETVVRPAPAWIDRAQRFVSGRAAIAAVLSTRPKGILWLPHYVCGAVLEAAQGVGFPVRHYALADDFGPSSDLPIDEDDTVLVIDYFGIAGETVKRAVNRFGGERVLVDASQSLFFPSDLATHIVYSPRKFAGLPDGGILVSSALALSIGEPDERGSIDRAQHLLQRTAGLREQGRESFANAERSLTYTYPAPMSRLTASMLEGLDFEQISAARARNASALRSAVPQAHPLLDQAPSTTAPLCVPVLATNAKSIRATLSNQRIFLAHYWPDAVVPHNDHHARILMEQTLFLPCDQRYETQDMERLITLVDQARRSS
jgi:hypothetical protein